MSETRGDAAAGVMLYENAQRTPLPVRQLAIAIHDTTETAMHVVAARNRSDALNPVRNLKMRNLFGGRPVMLRADRADMAVVPRLEMFDMAEEHALHDPEGEFGAEPFGPYLFGGLGQTAVSLVRGHEAMLARETVVAAEPGHWQGPTRRFCLDSYTVDDPLALYFNNGGRLQPQPAYSPDAVPVSRLAIVAAFNDPEEPVFFEVAHAAPSAETDTEQPPFAFLMPEQTIAATADMLASFQRLAGACLKSF